MKPKKRTAQLDRRIAAFDRDKNKGDGQRKRPTGYHKPGSLKMY